MSEISIEFVSPKSNPRRRRFLSGLVSVALGALVAPTYAKDTRQTIRIGFTPAFVHDQHALLDDWRRYMERRLGVRPMPRP